MTVRLTRRNMMKTLGAGLAFAVAPRAWAGTPEAEPKPDRPNIVLVMTDDQGYGDLACHGHPFIKTPNLDKLYGQSTRFTDFHVSPTCSPTRAALMSGLYPFKVGVTHTIKERELMSTKATTIAQVLKTAGYATGIFGKWHLGDADPYQPENRGFDEVFIHGAGGIGQSYEGSQSNPPKNSNFDPVLKHNGKFVRTKGFCTDVFFKQALGWMRDRHKENKPFFAYIPTNAPHSPFDVEDKYKDLYKDKCSEKEASFLGLITNIDDNMGLLMEKLDEWKLADNTLLIFMTDNGTSAGDRIYNAGMRGKKTCITEGGTRVPLFLRLPGRTKAGVDVDRLARHVDIFPTLVEIANAKVPEGLELDGRSLWPLVDNPKAEWKDRFTFFHGGRWSEFTDTVHLKGFAVRNQRFRLVNKSLYDIENDPGEKVNVASMHPEVVTEMTAAYFAWWEKVKPLLINEGASLKTGKPFRDLYNKQEASTGIPDWVEPKL